MILWEIATRLYWWVIYLLWLIFRLRLHRHWATSTHTNSGEGIVTTNKNDRLTIDKDAPTRVASQIKTVTSLFVELVKSNTPSIKLSVSNFTKRIPFQSFQVSNKDQVRHADKAIEQNNVSEAKTGIPSYFDLLGRKEKTVEAAIPLWKVKRKPFSQESVDTRTKHVVSAVAKAVTKSSLMTRLDDLCQHLFQYPQSKSLASRVRFIKYLNCKTSRKLIFSDLFQEGAVSILLRLKHSIPRDEHIQGQIREGLALLGYADPLPAKGIRILSIDGGGTRWVNFPSQLVHICTVLTRFELIWRFISRGLLALRILRHLEAIGGRPIYESFDYICGVSTGAVLALLIGASKKSISDVETMYRQISSEVFKQDRSSGLGGLLWSHAYYDTDKWESILKDKIGLLLVSYPMFLFS